MKFEWDDDKNRENITKHGLSFEDASRIFDGFTLDFLDDRFDYDEIREISIGMINGVAVITVAHTDRDGVCRIITARQANRKEKKQHDEALRQAFNA